MDPRPWDLFGHVTDAPMETHVRPATTADLFWLRLLMGQLFEEMPAAYPSPEHRDLETMTAIFASRLGGSDPTLSCWVAEVDQVVVGFLTGDYLTRTGRPRHYVFVTMFYVVPAWRSKGVGRALSEKFLQAAGQVGTEVCEFIAQAGDKQWRRRGWATVGIVHALPIDASKATLAVVDPKHPNGDSKIPT